eukprot:292259-Amphidinium_carterae.1
MALCQKAIPTLKYVILIRLNMRERSLECMSECPSTCFEASYAIFLFVPRTFVGQWKIVRDEGKQPPHEGETDPEITTLLCH